MTTVLRYLTRAALALALAIALLPASPAAIGQAQSAAPATTAAPDGKKVLTLADYGPWKRITQTAISDDGKWVTYTYSPNDGDETLFVKQLDGDKLYTIPIGSAGGAGRGGGGGGVGARRRRRRRGRAVLRQRPLDWVLRESAGACRGARTRRRWWTWRGTRGGATARCRAGRSHDQRGRESRGRSALRAA